MDDNKICLIFLLVIIYILTFVDVSLYFGQSNIHEIVIMIYVVSIGLGIVLVAFLIMATNFTILSEIRDICLKIVKKHFGSIPCYLNIHKMIVSYENIDVYGSVTTRNYKCERCEKYLGSENFNTERVTSWKKRLERKQ